MIDAEYIAAFQEAMAKGDVDAIKALANAPGEQMGELNVDDKGNPIEDTVDDSLDPISLEDEFNPGGNPAPQAKEKSEEDKAAAEAAAKTEEDAEAAKAKEESDKAIAAKLAEEEAAKEAELERKRIYTQHLPEERRELLKILADNPLLEPEDAKRIIAERAKGKEAEENTDELKVAKSRLDEVMAEIRMQDAKWQRDEVEDSPTNYLKLAEERDALLKSVAVMETERALEERGEKASRQQFEESWDANEARANKDFPGLDDPTSELYEACAGRSSAIEAIIDKGGKPPVVKIGDKEVTLDPFNPRFPYLVAAEQAAKIAGRKTTVATPVVMSPKPAPTQIVSGPSAASGTRIARNAAEAGLRDLTSTLGWARSRDIAVL
jgi:hypothetical protein